MVLNAIFWIITGIALGSIARVLMPGPRAGGISVAMLVGMAGAFAGALVSWTVSRESLAQINLYTLGWAVIGAMYILFAYRCLALRGDKAQYHPSTRRAREMIMPGAVANRLQPATR